jgi:hypothetical protein
LWRLEKEVAKIDEFVKSRKIPFFVPPAEAGFQSNQGIWTPAFAGVTALGTFYEAVKINDFVKKLSLRRKLESRNSANAY